MTHLVQFGTPTSTISLILPDLPERMMSGDGRRLFISFDSVSCPHCTVTIDRHFKLPIIFGAAGGVLVWMIWSIIVRLIQTTLYPDLGSRGLQKPDSRRPSTHSSLSNLPRVPIYCLDRNAPRMYVSGLALFNSIIDTSYETSVRDPFCTQDVIASGLFYFVWITPALFISGICMRTSPTFVYIPLSVQRHLLGIVLVLQPSQSWR